MFAKIAKKVVGSKNDRTLRRMGKVVAKINQFEESIQALDDAALRAKTAEFRQRLEQGASLDDILPEAFAVVREAAKRTLGLRHFDVQMIGGMTLHQGKIAEMRTGEGKTLVATLAAYLNALPGEGVHVITVNDYLARRDAQWMGPIYHALGLSVGVIQSYRAGNAGSYLFDPESENREESYESLTISSRRDSYAADITYGTNNEFGFDYLRDNMALRLEDKSQRALSFAIVDEVDSILIDEARTPLIISGAAQDSSALYTKMNALVKFLSRQQHSDRVRNTKIQAAKVRLLEQEGAEPEEMSINRALQLAEEKGLELVELEQGKMPLCQLLDQGDFVIDEKLRQVELTEQGHEKIEGILQREGLLEQGDSLYHATNLNLLHHVQSALKAHYLFHNNVEYIVQEDQVVLIDEHTGRTMQGRRLSEGLHQAIEAKEGLKIQQESQTLASTTFQNYFRIYHKLSGMTGTADTEAYEFHQIYGLEVVVIPTNVPIARRDLNDLIYLSQPEKYQAVIDDVKEVQARGAPVLVGTASVEASELLSGLLKKAGIRHQVLNAKHHEREAKIIAEAGFLGSVTIATNMAGRGTDIKLGAFEYADLLKHWQQHGLAPKGLSADDPELKAKLLEVWVARYLDDKTKAKLEGADVAAKEKAMASFWSSIQAPEMPLEPVTSVKALGGLHIIGTERHESRRIDNQLRGRAGRQGDPGLSRFYLSLEDPLMRLFASDRVKNMMRAMGMQQGEAIEHRMVTNAIEKAQRKVEGRNFDMRKHLLEYDDVANDQRKVIYQQRNDLLETDDISDVIDNIREDAVNFTIDGYIPPMSLEEQWDIAGLEQAIEREFSFNAPVSQWLEEDKRLNEEGIRNRLVDAAKASYNERFAQLGDHIRSIEKQVMLQVLDSLWKEHLAQMDMLRQGIGLRSYAQRNPKQEYKRESFTLFSALLDNIKIETVRFLSHIRVTQKEDAEAMERKRREQEQQMRFQHAEASALGNSEPESAPPQAEQPITRDGPKVGRNEPCPCGSGKKFKQCHGRLGS